MRSCLLLLCLLPLGGCLVEEVRVQAPVPGPDDRGRLWCGRQEHAIPPPAPVCIRRGPLPQDVPVSWYVHRRDESGSLLRAEARAQSPRPWWQTFPCDLVADFAPVELVASRTVVLEPYAVPRRDRAELEREAALHGYARSPAAP